MVEHRKLFQSNVKSYTLMHEPPDIYLDDHIMDIQFSPNANVLAVGQVTGEVRVYQYTEKKTQQMLTFNYHQDSCRRLDFSSDGNILYTASTDESIGVISNGVMEGRLTSAHKAAINVIKHIENGVIIATGDDDGCIKVWDLRLAATPQKKQACVMKFEEHEGTVSDIVLNDEKNMLLSSSNDGCLGVFDLRKPNELYAMSDNFEEDLTAICLSKYGKKVLVSTSEGIVNIFSWDWFGDCNDRIVGHPNSIDTMIKYDEDTIITGSEDGLIRAVSVLPNKIIAILGDPTDREEELFHIQRVALSHDRNLLASCSLDDIVKIIDVSHLNSRIKEQFDEENYEQDLKENPKIKRKKKKNKDIEMENEDINNEGEGQEELKQEEVKEGNEDWNSEGDSYDSEDDDDNEDDSDEDMSEQKKNKKKDKQLNIKGNNVQKSQKIIEKEKKQKFFDDL